ncbi:MAG TPA: polyhydroxyalkanoate synthesis regulator DNA-binding domain-containing protein [Kofleriaceae bacterium]|nr:polyhydroxyalkanoate synthesis regulator DNA-binding domain-containing protein [Kofleriaceae bacterium]
MSETRVIKRYANRKLYDTQHSRYVTLDQIADMIRGGDDVKIVDNKSKEDLTSVTLAQIIFEEEKRQKSFLPLQAMRNIIQSGGESITQLVHQAKGRVTQMLGQKKEDEREHGHPDLPGGHPGGQSDGPENGHQDEAGHAASNNSPGSHDHAVHAGNHDASDDEPSAGRRVREGLRNLREFREFLTHSQRAIDEWQRKVDGRIRNMVEGISPFSNLQKDIGALSTRIAQLEQKLTQLERDEPIRDESVHDD